MSRPRYNWRDLFFFSSKRKDTFDDHRCDTVKLNRHHGMVKSCKRIFVIKKKLVTFRVSSFLKKILNRFNLTLRRISNLKTSSKRFFENRFLLLSFVVDNRSITPADIPIHDLLERRRVSPVASNFFFDASRRTAVANGSPRKFGSEEERVTAVDHPSVHEDQRSRGRRCNFPCNFCNFAVDFSVFKI